MYICCLTFSKICNFAKFNWYTWIYITQRIRVILLQLRWRWVNHILSKLRAWPFVAILRAQVIVCVIVSVCLSVCQYFQRCWWFICMMMYMDTNQCCICMTMYMHMNQYISYFMRSFAAILRARVMSRSQRWRYICLSLNVYFTFLILYFIEVKGVIFRFQGLRW